MDMQVWQQQQQQAYSAAKQGRRACFLGNPLVAFCTWPATNSLFTMPMTVRQVEQGRTGASEDNGAGLPHLHPREVYELVLADHNFLYELAAAQLQLLWRIKRGCNLTSCSHK